MASDLIDLSGLMVSVLTKYVPSAPERSPASFARDEARRYGKRDRTKSTPTTRLRSCGTRSGRRRVRRAKTSGSPVRHGARLVRGMHY